MENINQYYEEKVNELQGYIDHFKRRMKDEMKKPDFEPNATKENNGYDGVITELNKNFDTMGIDKTEIFMGSEQTHRLLRLCTHVKNVQSFSKDQLYHALIGGTRRPYHDPRTDEFNDDITKNSQVEDLLDSRLLAELLLKEKEKLVKIQETLGYIQDYRKACKEVTTENELFIEGAKFTNQLMNNIGFLGMSFWTEKSEPEKYQKFFQMIGSKPKDRDLLKDPIISSITGGSPLFIHKDVQMVNDEILAKAIVEAL